MKFLKVLSVVGLLFFITNTAHSASVNTVSVLNSHELDVAFSDDVVFADDTQWDVKVLKDIIVSFATRDASDHYKVILTLEEDLNILTNYNLLSIYGADGNMDFKTTKYLNEVEIDNNFFPEDQGITKIRTLDERTLEVYFKYPVEDTDFEFKLFSENFVDNIAKNTDNSLKLHLEKAVEENSQYMLMVLNLKDNTGANISLNEDLFNFQTLDSIEQIKEDAPIIDDNGEEILEIETVALNAAETPDTGAETWVLVALTLMVNAGLFIRKKIKTA